MAREKRKREREKKEEREKKIVHFDCLSPSTIDGSIGKDFSRACLRFVHTHLAMHHEVESHARSLLFSLSLSCVSTETPTNSISLVAARYFYTYFRDKSHGDNARALSSYTE